MSTGCDSEDYALFLNSVFLAFYDGADKLIFKATFLKILFPVPVPINGLGWHLSSFLSTLTLTHCNVYLVFYPSCSKLFPY
jgi:hypothetical protein